MNPSEGLTDNDILAAVRDEVDWASEEYRRRSGDWKEALDYYYGRAPKSVECDVASEDRLGYSDAVSSDVADAVESVLAEILPAFTQSAPVEFIPMDEGDEEAAQDETDAVNHVANSHGMYMALNSACKDALLRRAGVVKVYWEERTQAIYEDIQGAQPQLLPQLLAPQQPDEQIEIISGEFDELTGTASGQIRRHRVTRQPRIEAVPLDEFLISANAASPELEDCRFVAHQRPLPRSELVELGAPLDVVNNLARMESTQHETGRGRTYRDEELRSAHSSTDYIMVCESYYRIDKDGDGIAELRRVITAGGTEGTDVLLMDDPWDDTPFALGLAYTGVYSWDGISLWDKLKDIQDLKTDILRDMRNLVARSMRQRLVAVEGDADMDDVLETVLGGVIRARTPNGVVPLQEVRVPPEAMSFLEYLDKMRRDQGGGAIDMASQTMAIAGDTAHGIERMMSAGEQRNAMIARNLAETLMKPLYRKLHKLLRQYQADPVRIPGSSGWRSLEPSQWSPRTDMVIAMGMSVGERTRRSAALQMALQASAQDAQSGKTGITTDMQGEYRARVDLLRLAGLPNPESYFVDPKSEQSQRAQQAAQQAQAQQAQQAQEQQQQMMQFQYSLMTDIERMKGEMALARQQMQEQSKQMLEAMKVETERNKMHLQQAEKMFGHRVDIASIEAELDKAEAKAEVDKLQRRAQ
jgi:hypothetical protein